jgi:hypothetical protein
VGVQVNKGVHIVVFRSLLKSAAIFAVAVYVAREMTFAEKAAASQPAA